MTEDSPIAGSADTLASDHGGAVVAAISRDIVGVHARYYGRGPTKAKTIWRDEVVVCILEDIFTKAEQLLVDAGRFEQVRAHRIAFHDEVAPLFREGVEARTGRRVSAFLSQIGKEGIVSEVFVLARQAEPPPD